MEDTVKVSDNPALQAVADIASTRPDLTADEWLVVEKASTYYKALLKPEVLQELEIEYAKKYDAFVDQARKDAQVAIQENFDKWKKSQEPLNTEELKKLISQDYEEFKVPLTDSDGNTRFFTIRELPKAVEMRLVKLAQRTLEPLFADKSLADFKWRATDSIPEKVNSLLGLIPNSLDVMAEICTICLDPYEKDSTITGKWVSENISTARIQAIVLLQFEVNKYRDFFYSAFRLFQHLSNRKAM